MTGLSGEVLTVSLFAGSHVAKPYQGRSSFIFSEAVSIRVFVMGIQLLGIHLLPCSAPDSPLLVQTDQVL